MEAVSLYDYYSFGFNYYILLNNFSSKVTKEFGDEVERYLEMIDKLDLKVTRSSLKLNGLEDDLSKLEKLRRGRKKMDDIPSELHQNIISKITKADATLDAEMSTKYGFSLHEKKISTDILLNNIHKLFASSTFYLLPEIAQYDFKEGGKCIAFNRFTASAFHALRGTEDVLKYYYSKILGRLPTERQTWGSFYTAIDREIRDGNIDPAPDEELMINIDNLRKFYRNKTQHPQLIYNSDEAQDLFFQCVRAVNQIYGDMKKRNLVEDLPF